MRGAPVSKRTIWQRVPLIQVRTHHTPALPELGVWVASTGYQIVPVLAWVERGGVRVPEIEQWQALRPIQATGYNRASLRHVGFSESLRGAKRIARDDWTSRSNRTGRRGSPRRAEPLDT